MAAACSFEEFEPVYQTTLPHHLSALNLLWSVCVEMNPRVSKDMSIGYINLRMCNLPAWSQHLEI